MPTSPKVLAFAGSTREASYNKKLLAVACRLLREHGAEVTCIDLRDYPMPLYDGDLEARTGIPDNGRALKSLFESHEGLLMACPEYNGSLTGVWKNTIDWVSRPLGGQGARYWFAGKPVALLSASPGGFGGMRGLVHARASLTSVGAEVLADQVSVPRAGDAFDEAGRLTDTGIEKRLDTLMARLATIIAALRGA